MPFCFYLNQATSKYSTQGLGLLAFHGRRSSFTLSSAHFELCGCFAYFILVWLISYPYVAGAAAITGDRLCCSVKSQATSLETSPRLSRFSVQTSATPPECSILPARKQMGAQRATLHTTGHQRILFCIYGSSFRLCHGMNQCSLVIYTSVWQYQLSHGLDLPTQALNLLYSDS